MKPDKLVYQINQIATFFKSQPEAGRVAGVANHVNRFWDPRMRRKLFELIESGHEGFDPLVLKAVKDVRPAPEEQKFGILN